MNWKHACSLFTIFTVVSSEVNYGTPNNFAQAGLPPQSAFGIGPSDNKLFNVLNSPPAPVQFEQYKPSLVPSCENTEILQKIWTILSSLLNIDGKSVEANAPERIKYALTLIKKYFQEGPSSTYNYEATKKIIDLETELERAKGVFSEDIRNLRSLLNVNPNTNENIRANVAYANELPTNVQADCKDAYLKLIQNAQEAYLQVLQLVKNPICSSAPDSKNNPVLTLPIYNQIPSGNGTDRISTLPKQTLSNNFPYLYDSVSGKVYANPNYNQPANNMENLPSDPKNNLLNIYYNLIQNSNLKPNNHIPSLIYEPPIDSNNVDPQKTNLSDINNLINSTSPRNGLHGDLAANLEHVKSLVEKLNQLNPDKINKNIPFDGLIPLNLPTNQAVPKYPYMNNYEHNPASTANPSNNDILNKLKIATNINSLFPKYDQNNPNLPNQHTSIPYQQLYQNVLNDPSYTTPKTNLLDHLRALINQQNPYLSSNNQYQYLAPNGLNYDDSQAKNWVNNILPLDHQDSISKLLNFSKPAIPSDVGFNTNKINELPGVDNLFKLGDQGEVELTYVLKRPQPFIYEPFYFIKYRLPYSSFIQSIQDLLSKKPALRSEPIRLYQEIIGNANAIDMSPDLLNYSKEDVDNLLIKNGALIKARIINLNNANNKGSDYLLPPNVDENIKRLRASNSLLEESDRLNNTMNKLNKETSDSGAEARRFPLKNDFDRPDIHKVYTANPMQPALSSLNVPYSALQGRPSPLANPYNTYYPYTMGPHIGYNTFTPSNNIPNPAIKSPLANQYNTYNPYSIPGPKNVYNALTPVNYGYAPGYPIPNLKFI